MKKLFNFFDPLVILGLLIGALSFELIFGFVVPASAQPFVYFDSTDQVLKLDNRFPSGMFTRGRLAQLRAKWQVNNAGWVSDIEYSGSSRNRPLVAIIGDSYIEAVQVDSADNVGGQLRRMSGDEYEVYTFGNSGGSLAQFLHVSRYVVSNFNPEILVFNVTASDFKPSLCKNARNVGVLCLNYEATGIEESPIIPSAPSRIRRLTSKSNVVRYLFFNVGIRTNLLLPRNPGQRTDNQATVSDGANVKKVDQAEREIELAMTYVLDRIAEENPNRRVIFMIDGRRQDIYSGRIDQNSDLPQKDLLKKLAQRHGFEFIDLMDHFRQRYELDNQIRFESKYDQHWNRVGHLVVAEAIRQKLAVASAESIAAP